MQVSEDSLGSLTTEDNDSGTSKHGSVAVSGRRRRTGNARLDPTRGVDIEDVCIIQVGEAVLLAFIVVTAKDDERSTGKCGRVSASGRGRNTFDLRESPKPFALNYRNKDGSYNLVLPENVP